MTPVHPQMTTDSKSGFQNQDLVSESYFLGCLWRTATYTTKIRHNSLTIEAKKGNCCPTTYDTLIPYSAIEDVTAVYGGCCGGSFRKVFIQTKSSGCFPHSTLVKGSDAVAYLMETIQSAMDSH